MECAGCKRRFGASVAEHMAACPICSEPWPETPQVPAVPEPALSAAAARPARVGEAGRWEMAPATQPVESIPPAPASWDHPTNIPPPRQRALPSRLFFAAPRGLRGLSYYDLVFVESKAALVPTRGGQEVLLWALFGALGYAIGRARARKETAPRLARLRPVADEVVASVRPQDVFPYADITDAVLIQGISATTLRLRVRGRRRKIVIKWNNGDIRGIDLGGAMRGILGSVARVKNRKRRHLILLGLLVSPIVAAIPAALLVDEEPVLDAPGVEVSAPALTPTTVAPGQPAPSPATSERPGTDEVRAACTDLGTFLDSLGERTALPEEFEVAMNRFAPRIDAAAAQDPIWAPAAAAAREMARLMRQPASPRIRAQVNEQASVIDGICGPVAWTN